MGDSVGDPIFIFFVIFMVLLFMILLIKRLNKKENPLDFDFASLEAFSRPRNHPIPTISVAVHLHEHNNRRASSHPIVATTTTTRIINDPTPPPPFESVVGENVDKSCPLNEPPPPTYEEYLTLREKFAAAQQQ